MTKKTEKEKIKDDIMASCYKYSKLLAPGETLNINKELRADVDGTDTGIGNVYLNVVRYSH